MNQDVDNILFIYIYIMIIYYYDNWMMTIQLVPVLLPSYIQFFLITTGAIFICCSFFIVPFLMILISLGYFNIKKCIFYVSKYLVIFQ